jgi:hypothetical protein
MDQVVEAVAALASVDVSETYVALLSVLALPSWLLSCAVKKTNNQKIQNGEKEISHTFMPPLKHLTHPGNLPCLIGHK